MIGLTSLAPATPPPLTAAEHHPKTCPTCARTLIRRSGGNWCRWCKGWAFVITFITEGAYYRALTLTHGKT